MLTGSASFAQSSYAPFVAMLPVLWLFASLGILKISTPSACFWGLVLSAVLAVVGWSFPPVLAFKAVLDGTAFAVVPILWVILAALLTYSIAVETKAMDTIKTLLASISHDRRIQALLIAWGFGGFMEAVAGFGTAVVVPAALLISLGFQPFSAAVLCLLANTVAVAFGVVGIPVTTLAWVTDLPVTDLATSVVLQLTPFVLVVPACIVLAVTKNVRGLFEVWPHTIAAGASFGVAQFFTAKYIGPELPAVLGSLTAFASTVVMAKYFPPEKPWLFDSDAAPGGKQSPPLDMAAQFRAWSPYIILLILVLASRMVQPLNILLAKASNSWLIYDGPGGKSFTVLWLLTPGSLVMVAAIIGGRIQGASMPTIMRLTGKTVCQMGKSVITIVCIVALAKILSYSGMISSVAESLAIATGKGYPFVAPILGMLGTFITGSDTSSNILFGQLQKQVALSIGVSPVWIAAANTSGACIGKLISLQSIAIASISSNLAGREGELLVTMCYYAAGFIIAMGCLIFAFT